ncbi:MAG: rhamnulokinase, partial [Candidatus Bipolaricaulota bacterium]
MRSSKNFIALDLGANSGRAVLGKLKDDLLETEEIHRFSNDPVKILGTIHWNVLMIFREVKRALKKHGSSRRCELSSIGMDTWGVDFGLLDGKGRLIENPVHYRDGRTEGMMDQVLQTFSREEIFRNTGIQFMEFNTLYQLLALKDRDPDQLRRAEDLLMMAGLLGYFLTGEKSEEFTLATTTQLYNPVKDRWSEKLFDLFDLPIDIMPKVERTGAKIGEVRSDVYTETGTNKVPVIATTSHDTASAVSGIPAEGSGWAFISSGTWSLMGKEIDRPLINREVMKANFTNEGCYNGRFTLHKNLTGLWIIQECKREWAGKGRDYSYDEIARMAREAEPFVSLIDTQADPFARPGKMTEKIRDFCRETDQNLPEGPSEIARTVLEGLALNYRLTLEQLEEVTREKISKIYIVGGGVKNELLSRFCANATG